jgi:antitoxin component of MazEF toxin-antitoxin module
MTMASAKIRPDYTVELPEELRGQVRPGDRVEVVVKGKEIALRVRTSRPDLREIIARIRRNPAEHSLSSEEIEDIIHQVRRDRR